MLTADKVDVSSKAEPNIQGQTPQEFVASLLALPDFASQQQFLATYIPYKDKIIQDEVADLLKEEANRFLRYDIKACLNISALFFEFVKHTQNTRHQALGLCVKADAYAYGGLGLYQEAVDFYDLAASIYEEINHSIIPQAVIGYAKLVPLASLGRYEEVFKIGKWASEIFENHEEWLLLAKLNVNLGIVYQRLGQDSETLALYNQAIRLYKQVDTEQARLALARVVQNRSGVLRNLGRFNESIANSKKAMAMLQATGQAAGVARAQQSLALTYFVLGRWNEGLALLDKVRATFFADGRRRDAVLVDLYISDCLLQLRRFSDVLEKCEETADLFAEFGTQFEVGQSTLNKAIAFAGLNHYIKAMNALEEARNCFKQEGNEVWIASTDLETAVILLHQGKASESYKTALTCVNLFAQYRLPVEQAQCYLVAARAALILENYSEADALIKKALFTTQTQNLPTVTYQAYYLLGKIAIEQNRLPSAKEAFDLAIEALETLRGRMMVEFRADFLEDKQIIYEDSVKLCLTLEKPDEGLLYAERAKSRALLDLLALSLNVGIQARDATDQELVNELTRLRNERDALYRRWAGDEATNERGTLSIDSGQGIAQQKILRLEKHITELWHKLLIRNADYARDAALCRVQTEPIQPYLDQETALIEYFVVHGQLIAFLITKGSIEAVQLPTKLPQIQQLLQLLWLNLRAVPRSTAKQQIQSATNTRGILQKLYGFLLRPLEEQVANYPSLIIVPHGPLHYLPFHALYHDCEPLLLQKEISYLPSASFLRYSKEADISGTKDIVLGNSYQGHLPFAVAEAQSIAQLLSCQVLVEDEATVAVLRETGENGRILHLAAHGDFRPDNPIFSGLALADGWLTTLDIFNLRLRASLVTLSACQTGRSVIGGGDELLGLMRAFLSAGAASLVLSLWAVEDTSTAKLMELFYMNLAAGQSKRAALQLAQKHLLLTESVSHPYYIHPYYWAPFYLVGNPGSL